MDISEKTYAKINLLIIIIFTFIFVLSRVGIKPDFLGYIAVFLVVAFIVFSIVQGYFLKSKINKFDRILGWLSFILLLLSFYESFSLGGALGLLIVDNEDLNRLKLVTLAYFLVVFMSSIRLIRNGEIRS